MMHCLFLKWLLPGRPINPLNSSLRHEISAHGNTTHQVRVVLQKNRWCTHLTKADQTRSPISYYIANSSLRHGFAAHDHTIHQVRVVNFICERLLKCKYLSVLHNEEYGGTIPYNSPRAKCLLNEKD